MARGLAPPPSFWLELKKKYWKKVSQQAKSDVLTPPPSFQSGEAKKQQIFMIFVPNVRECPNVVCISVVFPWCFFFQDSSAKFRVVFFHFTWFKLAVGSLFSSASFFNLRKKKKSYLFINLTKKKYLSSIPSSNCALPRDLEFLKQKNLVPTNSIYTPPLKNKKSSEFRGGVKGLDFQQK